MIQLNYRDSKPIYEQVKDGIKQMVYNGVLSADDKLPSVREMATTLAINPNTIMRAYKELEQEGFLCTQPGIGTFVNKEMDLEEKKAEELFEYFDRATKRLLFFKVSPDELSNRVYKLAKGGIVDDSGK